ncbi:hypothetical protein VULLAG_LOCUS23795 [Vulpes lagopus]
MRCKVPAAWRPGLRHTRSAARGYPSCRGQDAANATRHCNTQPVCWPPREPSPPPAGSGPAGAPPPSRLPPPRSIWGRPLGWGPQGGLPGGRGSAAGALPNRLGKCLPFVLGFLGSSGLFAEAEALGAEPSGVSSASVACPPAAPGRRDPLSPELPDPPRAAALGSTRCLNRPRGREAWGSGADLLCDFWMSHLASLGFTISLWGKRGESKPASPCWWKGQECKQPPRPPPPPRASGPPRPPETPGDTEAGRPLTHPPTTPAS